MPRSSCCSSSALGLRLCSHEPTSEASHSPMKTATNTNSGCRVSIRYAAGGFLDVPLTLRVAVLNRCSSSPVALNFSSSSMVFDFLGASLLRSLSSTLPTDSLVISAIVNSFAFEKVHHGSDVKPVRFCPKRYLRSHQPSSPRR